MFEHSIKVPRLYKTAANILKKVKNDGASLKGLILERKFQNIKALYALISETMRRQSDINYLLKKTQLLEKETRIDPWLASILIYELLWGKKSLSGESKPIKTILSYKQTLLAHCNELNGKNQTEVEKPRYVRVNTLKLSVIEAINGFIDEGWFLSKLIDPLDYEAFLEKVSNLEESEFMLDFHLKDLLIFPKKTRFYKHNAFLDSSIILQDKASCLPARILNPPPGSIVLDMCAAPGMKTTQLAAIMEDKGTIFAVERQLKRFETLQTMVNNSGATCIKTLHKDVLTVTNRDVPGVEYILVDPSCSASGMVDIVELQVHNLSPERIQQLARFQLIILKHALRNFPKCKRVVYSTCSIQPEENEEVVKEAISSNKQFKLVSAHEHLGAPWINFGSSKYGDLGKLCLYAKSEVDKTNGFFVAVFKRLQDGEENQFYNISNTYDPRFKYTKKESKRNNYNNGINKGENEYNGEENEGLGEISEVRNTEISENNEEKMVSGGNKATENIEMICSKKCKRKKKKEDVVEEVIKAKKKKFSDEVNNEGFDVESGKNKKEKLAEADDEDAVLAEKTRKGKKQNIGVESEKNNVLEADDKGAVVAGKTKKKQNNTDVESEKSVLEADAEDTVVARKTKNKLNTTDVVSAKKDVLKADDEDMVVAVKMKKKKKQNTTDVESEKKNILEADDENAVVAEKTKKSKKQNTVVESGKNNFLEAYDEDAVVSGNTKKRQNNTDVESEKKSVLEAEDEGTVGARKTKKKLNTSDVVSGKKDVLKADDEDNKIDKKNLNITDVSEKKDVLKAEEMKKKKKQNTTDVENETKNVLEADDEDVVVAGKTKKRKKQNTDVENETKNVLEANNEDTVVAGKTKKKIKQNIDVESEKKNDLEADDEDMVLDGKTKKKKKQNSTDVKSEEKNVLEADNEDAVAAGKTKKKKKQNTDVETAKKNVLEADDETTVVVGKTKSKQNTDVESEKKSVLETDYEVTVEAGKTKKNKKQNTDVESEKKNVLEADDMAEDDMAEDKLRITVKDTVLAVTKKKSKKEKEISDDVASEVCQVDQEVNEIPKKKKKKKSKD